jgi:uncharacterized protein (DUF927 family)
MKSYVYLAIAAMILIFLGMAAIIVATGLLVRETAEGITVVYNISSSHIVELKDTWEFIRSVGAF